MLIELEEAIMDVVNEVHEETGNNSDEEDIVVQ